MAKPLIAVRHGRQPGIYAGWRHARLQVDGFSNHEFKGFDTYEEAHRYLYGEPWADGPAFVQLSFDDGRVARYAVDQDAVKTLIS